MNSLDVSLTLAINQGWASPYMDVFMGWLSSKTWFSIPLTLFLLLPFNRNLGKKGVKTWIALVLCIGIGDASGHAIKQLTLMQRPCQAMPAQIRMVEQPFRYGCASKPHGMPSNHSLNFFLAATMSGMLLHSWSWGLGLGMIAVLVGLSRIYLGVHFPSQVLAGAIIGGFMGSLLAWLASIWLLHQPQFSQKQDHD